MKGDTMAGEEMPHIEATTSSGAATAAAPTATSAEARPAVSPDAQQPRARLGSATAMTDLGADAPLIVSAYDWGALGHVVDVGGGDGTLLIALLNEYPTLRGTVVDLPNTAEAARKMLAAAGLADRGNAVAGDFFGALPADAEGYLLCSVLHQWSDEDARTILRNCTTAAGEDGAVFVIEKITDVAAAAGHPRDPASLDSARERDVAELTALAESAGLTVAAVHTAGAIAILELAAR